MVDNQKQKTQNSLMLKLFTFMSCKNLLHLYWMCWTKKVPQFILICIRFLSRQEHKFELVLYNDLDEINNKI